MATEEHTDSIATGPLGRDPNYVEATGDRIDRLTGHLDALLQSLIGVGYESFSGLNEEIQRELLWLASNLASELHEAIFLQKESNRVTHG